jgi:DNA-binding transcriptional LysR family regulator
MVASGRIDLLRALEMFLALADSGNMTVASSLLRVTQSAVSQQIKLLEDDLGTTLFDRSRRPLRLTPSGIALRRRASELLSMADIARADIRQIAAGPLLHLRIAMFSTLAKTLAPPLVAEVESRKLNVRTLAVTRGSATYQGQELLRRDVDVVITSNPLYEIDGLERHELLHERFVMMLPVGVATKRLGLRELGSRLPLIRYSARTEAGRLIEQHLRRQRIALPLGLSFDAPDEMFVMVEKGYGFAITAPTHVVHALDPNAKVKLLELPGPPLGRSITLVARAGELGDLPVRLATLCRNVLSQSYLPRVGRSMPTLTGLFTVAQATEEH